MKDMFELTPEAYWGRVLVTAEVEFQGRRLTARQFVDEAAWNQSTNIQGEVKRLLRWDLANEILQVIDPKFTVQH